MDEGHAESKLHERRMGVVCESRLTNSRGDVRPGLAKDLKVFAD